MDQMGEWCKTWEKIVGSTAGGGTLSICPAFGIGPLLPQIPLLLLGTYSTL